MKMKSILFASLLLLCVNAFSQKRISNNQGIEVQRFKNLENAGTGTRVGTWTSTGISGNITNAGAADGMPLIINGGSISWGWGGGTYVGLRVLTSGTSYTPTTGTKSIVAHLQGGGGGGGGASGSNSNVGAGAGGGSGSYLIIGVAVSDASSYTYALGAAGTAGANTGGTGGTGGNTTLTVGATTYTAPGGVGGVGQTAGTTAAATGGGAGGAVSTNGNVNRGGEPGMPGYRFSGTVGISGNGGSSLFGGGGAGITAAGAGNTGTGFGAGGSGALSTANTNRAGGAGTAGVIVIYEYR